MPEIRWQEMEVLDDVLQMGGGYVLNFSDKTMRNFMWSEFRLDLEDDKYCDTGSSKARRLRRFLSLASGTEAGHILRGLWTYRQHIREQHGHNEPEPDWKERRYFEVIARLEGTGDGLAQTDAIERFVPDETLDELVAGIQRDVEADSPQVALDRLHTYCMKKFAHMLRVRDGDADIPETLNGRLGRYLNPIRQAGVRPITGSIMKSAVQMMEMYNGVRNNDSLAHDNELIDRAEARYIFDSVVSMLRFLRAHEPADFGT
jgi:hypothetical protein